MSYQECPPEQRTPETWERVEQYCADSAGQTRVGNIKVPPIAGRVPKGVIPPSLEVLRDLQDIWNQQVTARRNAELDRERDEGGGGNNGPGTGGKGFGGGRGGNRNPFSSVQPPSLDEVRRSFLRTFAPRHDAPGDGVPGATMPPLNRPSLNGAPLRFGRGGRRR